MVRTALSVWEKSGIPYHVFYVHKSGFLNNIKQTEIYLKFAGAMRVSRTEFQDLIMGLLSSWTRKPT